MDVVHCRVIMSGNCQLWTCYAVILKFIPHVLDLFDLSSIFITFNPGSLLPFRSFTFFWFLIISYLDIYYKFSFAESHVNDEVEIDGTTG